MPTCQKCGDRYSFWSAEGLTGTGVCRACHQTGGPARRPSSQSAAKGSISAASDKASSGSNRASGIASTLMCRYSDAYQRAHAVVVMGALAKRVAVALALAILAGGWVVGLVMATNDTMLLAGIAAGVALACLVGVPMYVLGILVAAWGQTQLAALDTAVNTSRHLKDDEVAKILSKRFSA